MSIITLTSDYGLKDYRVAAIKGSILSLNQQVTLVDISHEIDAYHLAQAAYTIRNAYPYFPKNTVHIIAVDSFYHKQRRSLLCRADEQYFLAADNGLFSLIFRDKKPEAIYEITLNNRFDDIVGLTSTDIFAPVAAHLCNGGLPEVIGRKIKNAKQLNFVQPIINVNEKMIIGKIIGIDHFGNLITNISQSLFEKEAANFDSFKIKVRNLYLKTIYSSYTEIVNDWTHEDEFHGKAAAVFNDAGFLEISIYKGSKHNGAHSLFGIHIDENIYIEFE